MATTSTSFGFRIPATYPNNQNFPAVIGNISTDNETQPDLSGAATQNYTQASRAAYSAEKRNITVQTGNFYTDGISGKNPNQPNSQGIYTTVPKSAL